MSGTEQPGRPARSLLVRQQLPPRTGFAGAEPASSLGSIAEGAALRGAETLASEEGARGIPCGRVLPGHSSQMFITFGSTVLPQSKPDA